MPIYVSPNYRSEHFPPPWKTDDKIEIFRDRTLGWMLDVADQMINGQVDASGKELVAPLFGSGFAVLQVLFCYFEMIAKYIDGYTSDDKSRYFFYKGVMGVFPELINHSDHKKHLEWLYEHGRCGLYHMGATGSRIVISGELPQSIVARQDDIVVNPHLLARDLKVHFKFYIDRLKESVNIGLRTNFEKRFNEDC